MKKLLAALLAAVLLICCASALAEDEPMVSFQQPDGVEVCEVRDLGYFPAPEGLQPLYALMQDANDASSPYVFIMPNGRALMSLASTTVAQPGSAQSLMDAWADIALSLANQAESVNTDIACASMKNCYGYDGIRIETEMVLSGDVPLKVNAIGEAFYQGTNLVEIWTVYPAADESDELKQDMDALSQLKQTLTFDGSGMAELSEDGRDYQSTNGFFAMTMPESAVVITAETDGEEIERHRQAYAGLGAEASLFFEEWMKDVTDENATLILLPDYGMAFELYCEDSIALKDATLDTFRQMGGAIADSLDKRYGKAVLLDNEDQVIVAGLDHALLTYWLGTDETGMMLSLLAVIDGDGLLREVDMFSSQREGVEQVFQTRVLQMVLNTLKYQKPMQQL